MITHSVPQILHTLYPFLFLILYLDAFAFSLQNA